MRGGTGSNTAAPMRQQQALNHTTPLVNRSAHVFVDPIEAAHLGQRDHVRPRFVRKPDFIVSVVARRGIAPGSGVGLRRLGRCHPLQEAAKVSRRKSALVDHDARAEEEGEAQLVLLEERAAHVLEEQLVKSLQEIRHAPLHCVRLLRRGIADR